jgi:hypothetical protein
MTALAGLLAASAAGCGSSGGGSSSTSAASTAASSTGSASSLAPVSGTYSPGIDPANFVDMVDNRYFPLKPGTGFHYRGVAEDGKTPQSDDMVVTQQTKEILGVRSTVVSDIVSSGGKQIERTFDWYAQDKYGNVWYMGEDTRELQNGKFVKADDSWEAGVNGAQPGIIMPGSPRPDGSYRQEYYAQHAEDQARILGSGGALTVPAGSFPQTLSPRRRRPSSTRGSPSASTTSPASATSRSRR